MRRFWRRALYDEIHYEVGRADIHKALASVYVRQGLYANAYESLTQTLQIAERMNVTHDIAESKGPLGDLYVLLGRLDEAESLLKDAAHGHGTEALPEVLLSQAELARARGRAEAAADLYARANARGTQTGQKEIALRRS